MTYLSELYIIPRTDMASMTSGRTIAQACHAANQFTMRVMNKDDNSYRGKDAETYFSDAREWHQEADGFGTTIILQTQKTVNQNKYLKELVKFVKSEVPYIYSDFIVDPTYPLKDGNFTHLIPLITVAYMYIPGYVFDNLEKYGHGNEKNPTKNWDQIVNEIEWMSLYGTDSDSSVEQSSTRTRQRDFLSCDKHLS